MERNAFFNEKDERLKCMRFGPIPVVGWGLIKKKIAWVTKRED